MQLKPFLLDAWLDQYEHDIEFNLAASTGPTWTVNDILALADDETRHRFLNHNLAYSRPAGADSLREAIAEMQRVPIEAVQIMTGASDAQAFKRACSCFGLGRYFYDIQAIWVDLDQNRQPVRTPALSAWALPENWRKGMRPSGRNGNGSAAAASNGANGRSQANGSNPRQASGNARTGDGNTSGSANKANGDDLDVRIQSMEKTVGTVLYRNILREYGRVNQPKLIRDPAVKRKVLQMLESVARGIDRLEAVTKRLDPNTVTALLAKLQAPPLGEISDLKTLQHIVFGLEEFAGPDQHHAA